MASYTTYIAVIPHLKLEAPEIEILELMGFSATEVSPGSGSYRILGENPFSGELEDPSEEAEELALSLCSDSYLSWDDMLCKIIQRVIRRSPELTHAEVQMAWISPTPTTLAELRQAIGGGVYVVSGSDMRMMTTQEWANRQTRPRKTWMLRIYHNNGCDTYVSEEQEYLYARLYRFVSAWWSCEGGSFVETGVEPPPIPNNTLEAIALYFDQWEELEDGDGERYELFEVNYETLVP